MVITDLLERNAREFKDETALVEIAPSLIDTTRMTWKEYALIQPNPEESGRQEITWGEFNRRANCFANLLLSRGIKKGDKVSILLMNCLEWLPIYFGILKTGALAVPLNYRYTSDEIRYCLDLSDSDALIFGPEFIGRVEEICDSIPKIKQMFYVGKNCPTFAESYDSLLHIVQVKLLTLSFVKWIMQQFIFHQAQLVFQRQFFIITKAFCTLQKQNKITTDKQEMMCSYVFLPFTIREQKCIGSEAFIQVQKLFY